MRAKTVPHALPGGKMKLVVIPGREVKHAGNDSR
jgi:hypothetical protein